MRGKALTRDLKQSGFGLAEVIITFFCLQLVYLHDDDSNSQ